MATLPSITQSPVVAQPTRSSLMTLLVSAETAAIVALFALYRTPPTDNLLSFCTSPAGMLAVGAIGIGSLATVRIVSRLRTAPPQRQRLNRLTIALNLVMAITTAVAGETALRIAHEIGMRIPQVALNIPELRNWPHTASAFRAAIQGPTPLYHEFDPELGWAIGKNRVSTDGLHASNREGLRSAHPDETRQLPASSGGRDASSLDGPIRIALLGDSFTFGYEVAFQDTWATQLATRLGKNYEVQNFGVIGYSANQIRLRYQRDARPHRPDLVIVGLISHDVLRDSFISNFLPYPDMLALPYARPQPILHEGTLVTRNRPLPSPEEIFSHDALTELRFLDKDPNYNPLEWERASWRLFQRSFVFRMLASWPPREPMFNRFVFTEEQRQIHRAIVSSLRTSIEETGAIPVFLFFPKDAELEASATSTVSPETPYAVALFQDLHVPLVDMSDCVRRTADDQRFMPRKHYSPAANRSIAECLMEILPPILHNTQTRRIKHRAAKPTPSAQSPLPDA